MKSFALAALSLLSVASAVPLEKRQASTEFSVTGFSAECIPHSSHCYFNLNATVSPSTTVSCPADALSYQSLPDLPLTGCADSSVSFSFTHVEGGANLEINWGYDVGRNLTGTRFIPDSEIVWENTAIPTGRVQVYEGPKDFVITDLQAVVVL